MTPEEMQRRFKAYALRVLRLLGTFPRGPVGGTIGWQLAKAATSAAANYRAACLARSRPDFIHTLGIVEEEADESVFWIDLAADAGLTKRSLIGDLLKEGHELVSMTVRSRKAAKSNLRAGRTNRKERGNVAAGKATDKNRQ